MLQIDIDKKNAEFWNELCGSYLANSLERSKITNKSL
jgi:hypothetical protein